MRLLPRVLVRLHPVEQPQYTLSMSLVTQLLDSRVKWRCVAVSLPENAPLSRPAEGTLRYPLQ